jgi:competence protein ComEC
MLLIGLGVAWIAGLLPVGAWGAPWWMGAAWVAATGTVLVAQRRARPAVIALAVALAVVAGYRLDGALAPPGIPLSAYVGQEVIITGTVVSEPDPGDLSTGYDIRVERLELRDGRVLERAGTIRAWLHQYASYLPGDRFRLEGKLEAAPVFDGFDYRAYLARRGIGGTMGFPKSKLLAEGPRTVTRELTRLRLDLDRSLQRALPEPEASLGAGIAFGRDGGLSREAKEDFNASGLRHLVAVSGANLVMVAALTMAIAVRVIGRRRAWPLAALTVAAYVVIAGFEASVVRAAIMTAVLFAGEVVGRPQSGLPGLAAAIIVMTAIAPGQAVEPGFQLSAAATAGLLTLGPWLRSAFDGLRQWWPASWLPGWLTEVAALSLAATIATTPVTWAHFGAISLVGPLANVVAQPIVALAFWTSLATAVIGLAWPGAAPWTGAAAYYPLAFIVDLAREAAALPASSASVGPAPISWSVAGVAGFAAVAGLLYRYLPPAIQLPDAARSRSALGNRLLLAGASGALALQIALGLSGDSSALTIDVLDVGQGDAILLTTPGGRQVLVDGGPSGLRLARELGAVMPYWDRSVELVIISHPQEDHIGGLPALAARYTLGPVVSNGDRNESTTGDLVDRSFSQRAVVAAAGDRFEIDGVSFEVLWPRGDSAGRTGELNDRSLVLLVGYAGVQMLLTGDIEASAQRQLLARGLAPVDVLKVPHHGARTSDRAFLSSIVDGLAVISVGAGNRFGHPHPATLEALSGTTVLRTDVDGRIRIVVRDGTIRVRTGH